MDKSLVEQLYDSSQSDALKKLFQEDLSSRIKIKEAISEKLLNDRTKIITSNPIDVLFLICLNAKFADSEDECNRVAITIYQYYDKTNELIPSIVHDQGLSFSSKCLISLAFHPQALERRWKYHGAPKPSFYRTISKNIYSRYDQHDIAAHHEKWEMFVQELFI